MNRKGVARLLRRLAALLLALLLLSPALAEPLPSFPPEALAPYITLVAGMQDPSVGRLKQRLFELGYFRSNVVNNAYTEVTAGYVRQFQREMGLPEDGIASPYLQALFFSEHARPKPQPTARPTATPAATPTPRPSPTPYVEPDFPVQVGDQAGVHLQGAKLWFSPEVENRSRSQGVQAYVLQFYGRDEDGYVILPGGSDGIYLRFEHRQPLKPEEKLQAPEVLITGMPGLRIIHAAVTEVQLMDGSWQTQPREHWRFHAWDLPWTLPGALPGTDPDPE